MSNLLLRLKPVGTIGVRRFQLARSLNNSSNKDKLKHNQNKEEEREQKLFDKNQERLEKLEHDEDYKDYQQPSQEELKIKGDKARIEQNRPDDGVY